MIAALIAALPFLAPLLGKLPSLATLKLIVGGVAVVLTVALLFGGGFALGHRWEADAFNSYKAKAAAHELALQQKYDAIGGDEAADYLRTVETSQAETQRQLDGLRYAPPIPAPPSIPGKRGHKPSAPVSVDSDAQRVVRVLRDAAGSQE